MDYSKRTSEWSAKFFKHLDESSPDLVMCFYTKILFSPNMENPTVLHAGYSPLEATDENKELRDRMFIVFEDFLRSNPV